MPRTIAIVIFPEFQLLDAAGPIAAFELAGREAPPSPYRLRVVAAADGPVASSSGVMLTAEPLGEPAAIDTLLVTGGLGAHDSEPHAALLRWLREAATGARRVASVCTGAYLLGAAGLLDGRRATTHWRYAAELARRYPGIRVEPDRIFVRDGNVVTGGGVTAGIDFALSLVAEIAGPETAQAIQLGIEYAPAPPFDAGSPETAPPEVLARTTERYAAGAAQRRAAVEAAAERMRAAGF